MELEFVEISIDNYDRFHKLMVDYYRDGEDKDTPQEELDAFIKMLFELMDAKKVNGQLVKFHEAAIGFALWVKDTLGGDFSEIPGHGTILEIGIEKEYQDHGFGKEVVSFAEDQMIREGVDGLYVCAYGPAQIFWKKCGYIESDKLASNGLPIFIKDIRST